MKKHRRKTTGRLSALLSLLLVATMAQPLFQTRAAENDVTMDGNVTWSYLDDGSDPAGDSIAAGYQAMTGQAGPRMTMTYLHGRQRQVLLEQRKEKSMIWVADVHQRHY